MYMWLASSAASGAACILIPKGQNKLMPLLPNSLKGVVLLD